MADDWNDHAEQPISDRLREMVIATRMGFHTLTEKKPDTRQKKRRKRKSKKPRK